MNTAIKTALFVGLFIILFGTMKSNAEAIIKAFESNKLDGDLNAYQDSAGIWTIGFGSIYNYDLNRPVKKGDVITKDKAIQWLKREIKEKTSELKKLILVPVNQNQFDALTSFVYNIGVSAFKKSTLLKLLNQNADKIVVADQFLRWNKAKDKKTGKLVEVRGLTNRRKLERELFLK